MFLSNLLSMLLFMGVPLIFTTLLLSLHAYVRWRQTMDKILRGMKVKDVHERVERAVTHRKWARYHAILMAIALVVTIVLSAIFPAINGNYYRPLFDDLAFPMIFWVYCLFIPHMLALFLYHIRWNPQTLQRKQKLDAEDGLYEGNYELDADAQYGVNEEGELVRLVTEDVAQEMQQS